MEHQNENLNESGENQTYRDKRREKAREKRHKDQMSVTVFGLIIYSIALIGVVVLAYVGFKSAINKAKERQQIAAEEDLKKKAEEEKALAEQKKAEEEAAAAKALEEEQKKAEEAADSSYQDKVFSVIENVSDPGNAPVNSFDFVRKTLTTEAGKLVDYEIYTNPETGLAAKITTRENCGDLFEITDYYYDDGKINYIAQYREDTDVPVDISTDKIESRFYFNNDKMVKYIYCENGKAIEYSKDEFPLYGDGTIEEYKYMEDMMLECSKTAYKDAKELEESVVVSGYIMDELNCAPNSPAVIELMDSNGRVVQETETNGDGYYFFLVEPKDNTQYHLHVYGREDMIETNVYGISIPRGTKAIDVETVYLAYTVYDTIYPVQFFVKDADDANKPISNADIRFRYGLNNRDGEICLSGVLGEAGEIMPSLRSGNYTAEITKSGYETCYVSFSVKSDHTAVVAYAVKDVPDGSYKCVLSYEMTPLDVDLRAFDTYGRNVMKASYDSMGVTAAETISFSGIDSGTYTFYASDYTDIVGSDMMSYRLSQSGAKIYVYDGNGLNTVLPVPAGHAGIIWRPFEIRNHRIFAINDYYAYIVDDSVFRAK